MLRLTMQDEHGMLRGNAVRLGIAQACAYLVSVAAVCLPLAALAQSHDPINSLRDLPALRLPDRPVEGTPRPEPEMALHKPAGRGPFATVIVLHGCGGIQRSIGDWTSELLKGGYVVLVLDSLSQRGVRNNCRPPLAVPTINGALDTYRALEHLANQPYVDRNRIALIGFSWGGMAALLSARGDLIARLPRLHKELRFRAVTAVYPICFIPSAPMPRGPIDIEYLGPDTDLPLLVLMGGKDEEAPPKLCLPRLEALKAKGGIVEWQVYPDATHSWDQEQWSGHTVPTVFGGTHTYRYNADTAQASRKRVLEFFDRELGATGRPLRPAAN